jgi:hypothetical protein
VNAGTLQIIQLLKRRTASTPSSVRMCSMLPSFPSVQSGDDIAPYVNAFLKCNAYDLAKDVQTLSLAAVYLSLCTKRKYLHFYTNKHYLHLKKLRKKCFELTHLNVDIYQRNYIHENKWCSI